MTLFSDLEKLVTAAIDNLHGEPTRIDRRKREQFFGASIDPDRPSITAIGIIDFNPVAVMTHTQKSGDGMVPQLAGDRIHVSYATSQFSNALNQPQVGDLIVATTRTEDNEFRVTRVDPDGIGRIVCVCTKS